jgi:6-pyruvoyl-tetrahydropterin synthase
MRTLTGVGGIFCAAHRDLKSGALHGHSWEVTAWFTGRPNAAHRQEQLAAILRRLDHTELSVELRIADQFDDRACVQVDVARPLERLYARWER